MLTVARIAGTVIGILGLAMLRREREDAADDHRPVRPALVAVSIAVAVVGIGVTLWAIFAR